MPLGVNFYDEERLQGRNVANANAFNIVSPGIVEDGLVLHLDAGNRVSYPTSGTVWYDLSEYRNSGTLTNGPTATFDAGGSIDFDGTNDYVTISNKNIPTSGTQIFTLNFWVYFDSISGKFGPEYNAAILMTGDTTSAIEFIVLTQNTATTTPHTLSMALYGGPTTGSCTASVAGILNNSSWNNIVLIRDSSSSQRLYLNNSLLVTGNVSSSYTAPASTFKFFGATSNSAYSGYLNGRANIVQVYNRALTPTEVEQNFNATRARFGV